MAISLLVWTSSMYSVDWASDPPILSFNSTRKYLPYLNNRENNSMTRSATNNSRHFLAVPST